MSLNEIINNKMDIINNALDAYLAPKYPEIIYDAMAYSVGAGGKRLRPILLIGACEAVGGSIEDALPFACAIEMIHTYSLIHDDLPAMDNDDLRRGKPTCHKKFDEGLAILAGDGLLTYAFQIMLNTLVSKNDMKYAYASEVIAKYSGMSGMLVGQVVDIKSEGKEIDNETLTYIHDNKTGGLIKASLLAGAIIGGASEDVINELAKVGYNIGMAFQIKDDILDITSTIDVLGKPVFSDEKNDKYTYVTIHGLEKAQEDCERFTKEAMSIIKGLGERGEFLYNYVEGLINRKK